MIKQFFTVVGILGVSFILISWGAVGHRIINYDASLSFNSEMSMFSTWPDYLRDHASDADNRKSSDPTESPQAFY